MAQDSNAAKATKQVAWALVRLRSASFTRDELIELYWNDHHEPPEEWTGVLADFTERGYLHRDGERYRLTPAGEEFADTIRGDMFGDLLVSLDDSQAYDTLCALLYGKDLGQFSMLTMEQLDHLLHVLQLSPQSRVLDLGCSVGRITEYIADVTRAQVTGLDFAGPAIRRARERTTSKAEQLTFVVGSMNRLDRLAEHFDAIIALDTLYFATDLPQTLRALKERLRSPGQMGLFWTATVRPDEDMTQLQADKTRLAIALQSADLTFQVYDYTAAEKQHWQRRMALLEELKPAFETEGSTSIYESLVNETRHHVAEVVADRISRYLYHIQV